MASYTVKRGDTLSAIAKKNGTTVDAIAKASGISNPNVIYAGQKITIPSATNTNKNTTKSNSKNTSNNGSKNTPKSSNPTFDGVDQKYMDIAFEEYKPSEKENYYLGERDKYGQSMVDKINAGPQFSESVTKTFEWIDGQLEYFKNGKTSWDDKIFGQVEAIENREKFEYDVDNDQLFQQALASAMNSGKTAMQDTIGQASSLTGGYGSTYATSAGNQAYNEFIEDAYDNLPQYYQMALDAYKAEGEEMYNLLGVYAQMGEQEWNRNVDSFTTALNYGNSQRDFEYGVYQDDITNTYNVMNMYGDFYEQENTKNMLLWQQDIDNAWKTIGLQEDVRQFDANYGLNLNEYKLSTGDTDADGKLSADEIAAKNTNYVYDDNGKPKKVDNDVKEGYVIGDDGKTYKEPTSKQKQDALKAYNQGKEAYNKYMNSLPNSVYKEGIRDYVKEFGEDWVEDYNTYSSYEISKDTYNGGWFFGSNWLGGGEDHNDEYSIYDKNGKATETLSYDDLKKKINNSNIPDEKKKELLEKLKKQSKK